MKHSLDVSHKSCNLTAKLTKFNKATKKKKRKKYHIKCSSKTKDTVLHEESCRHDISTIPCKNS